MGYGEEFDETRRGTLRVELAKCKTEQIDVFNQMYGSVEEIKPEKMRWAYRQIMATLKENREKLDGICENNHN